MSSETIHDRIAKRAYEHYLARLERNESGDAEGDWIRAKHEVYETLHQSSLDRDKSSPESLFITFDNDYILSVFHPYFIAIRPPEDGPPYYVPGSNFMKLVEEHFQISDESELNKSPYVPQPPFTVKRWLFSGGGSIVIDPTLTHIIATICAAGGVKAFVDLIKAWVDERKGRKVTFKKGEIEIILQGGSITKGEVERLVKLFEEHFESSKIIQTAQVQEERERKGGLSLAKDFGK